MSKPTDGVQVDSESRCGSDGERRVDEGTNAVRVGIIGHFTPSIEQTDSDAARDENAVYFKDLHTSLLRVHSWYLSGAWEYGRQTPSAVFLTGVRLWSTIPASRERRMPAYSVQEGRR